MTAPPPATTCCRGARTFALLAAFAHASAFVSPHAPARLVRSAAASRSPPESLHRRGVALDPSAAEPEPLFFVDRTWRRGSRLSEADRQRADDVSQATMAEAEGAGGGDSVAWSMSVPITFDFRVVEAPGLLEVGSDALVFGHMPPEQASAARKLPQRRLVIVDENVDGLYGQQLRATLDVVPMLDYTYLALPMQEEAKDMDLVLRVAQAMTDFDIDRRSEPVLAIGGGVALDVVGLASTLYRRKVPWIRVPTTLLAYVDASVGAKTGVNFSGAKNRLGAYVPPTAALLDPVFFKTQSEREIAQGLSEIMKMALAKDRDLFELLEDNGARLLRDRFRSRSETDTAPAEVLRHSISMMLEELTPNLWEQSLTRLVDLGHVFGHEIEMANLGTIQHGEAVAMDMALCTVLSMQRGSLSRNDAMRILRTFRSLQMPLTHALVTDDLLRYSLHARRKASMGLKLPLPVAVGRCDIFEDVTEEQVVDAHHELHRMEASLRLESSRILLNIPAQERAQVREPVREPVFYSHSNATTSLPL